MKRVDHGRKQVTDDKNGTFEAFVTEYEDACPKCGEVVRGESRVDVEMVKISGGEHRRLEDRAFERLLSEEMRKHYAKHAGSE